MHFKKIFITYRDFFVNLSDINFFLNNILIFIKVLIEKFWF